MTYFIIGQYLLIIALLLFFLYSFRVRNNTKFAWMLRIFISAQILEYTIVILQYFSIRMLHDPAINEQIYFRHIPMGIAYIVFFVLYVTTNYRGNLHFTITQNAKEQKELNTEVIGK